MNDVQKARKILEDKWMAEGRCGSCGYHATLGEHDVCDEDIEHALANGGELHLGCLNGDDEDCWNHRGVRINIKP